MRKLGRDRDIRIAIERAAAALERLVCRGRPSTLAIVGAVAAEGATTASLSISDALASKCGRKVLLVEADAERPALWSLMQDIGMRIDKRELPSGFPEGVCHAELGPSLSCCVWEAARDMSAARAFLGELLSKGSSFAQSFDLMVIDLPPVVESAESAAFAGQTDATLFVAAYGKHRASVHEDALNELHLHNANVIGLLFNRRRSSIPSWVMRTT